MGFGDGVVPPSSPTFWFCGWGCALYTTGSILHTTEHGFGPNHRPHSLITPTTSFWVVRAPR